MRHAATREFWKRYRELPAEIRVPARKNYVLLRKNPRHPGLQFKRVGPNTWSARVGIKYRALAAESGGVFIWFWIGSHEDYERLIGG